MLPYASPETSAAQDVPAAAPPGTAPAAGPLPRFHRELRRAAPALLGYAAVRLLGIVVLARWAHAKGHGLWPQLAHQWDSRWYLGIADHGYDHVLTGARDTCNLAFFPLYPVLVKAVAGVTPGSRATIGLLLSLAASLVAAWGVFAVGDHLHGRRVGILLAVLWGATPVALVQSMGYTESLFTALTAWSLWAVLTGRWVWAGSLSLLAGLTRPTGVAVAAAVMVSAVAALWARRHADPDAMPMWARRHAGPDAAGPSLGRRAAQPAVAADRPRAPARPYAQPCARPCAWPCDTGGTRLRVILGAALAPLGWLGYLAWVGHRLGRWDGYFAVQKTWTNELDWGIRTLRDIRGNLVYQSHPQLFLVVVSVTLIAAVVLYALCLADRQPLPLLVFTGVLLAIVLGSGGVYFPRARFLLPAFPLLLPIAAAVAGATRRTKVLVLGGAALSSAYFGAYMALVWPSAP
ncbi:hypothetical protein ACQUSR_20195 [Streptomyces sp. P1-3]|uniref:hypothetical protein n=1 Tax=Streptomyces sp. P1-3 TaxID=3421658 RepID=UPI003D36AF23